MKHILILEQLREPENTLFASLGQSLELFVTSVDPGHVELVGCTPLLQGQALPGDFDALVVRSYRRFAAIRQIARAFRVAGKPVFGLDPEQASFTQDKLCDLMDLQAGGVAVPHTWARPEDTPMMVVVAKENWGYGGSGVELVDMTDIHGHKQPALAWVNHHFQEFLPAEEDWRVLVCEGQALPWVIRRRPQAGDFRTNTHQGGELEVIPLEHFPQGQELAELAVNAAMVLHRPCAGVDMRQGCNGKPVVLEVNRTPRLRLGVHTEEVIRRYLTAWAQALQ